MRPNFIHHLHPPSIPALQARWRHTLGMGGAAVFLALVLGVTGALEMFFYTPTPQEAALSIQELSYSVPFGGLLRNLHFWAAQLLLIVSGLHLFRVVFTGSYAPPRRFNYLLGMGLFVLVILLNFSGYILRWDKGIQWALVVGTNLARSIPLIGEWLYRFLVGGNQPGAATLIRFYSWHLYGLTIAALILVIWHAFRVRRDGGIAVPPPVLRKDLARISRFKLVGREVSAMLLLGASLLILALLFPAPISPAMTAVTPGSEARAPWFFLWGQEMLTWGDPFLWGVAVPLLLLLVLGLIPYVLPNPKPEDWGSWFPRSNRLAQLLLSAIILFFLFLTFLAAS